MVEVDETDIGMGMSKQPKHADGADRWFSRAGTDTAILWVEPGKDSILNDIAGDDESDVLGEYDSMDRFPIFDEEEVS